MRFLVARYPEGKSSLLQEGQRLLLGKDDGISDAPIYTDLWRIAAEDLFDKI